jgi:hypothetical protein
MENVNLNDDIIDIEQFAKEGENPPKGRKYRIRIDRETYVVSEECMTGKELLILAGKNPPERFQLRQKLKGGQVVGIRYDEEVCFTKPGIERFMTIPLDQTEGNILLKQFTLLEEDESYLNSLGYPWETLTLNGLQWVLIHNYPIPQGYNVELVTVAIQITPGYPTSQLDMGYFFPALQRKDGKAINALSTMEIDGKSFQRWSRHRTIENPWRVGIDNLSTHIALVDFWLSNEFVKHP